MLNNSCFFFAKGSANEGFTKPELDSINVNQINAIINRSDLRNRTPFNHPRSAHILLSYPLPY